MLPDVSGYQEHRVIDDIDFEGVPVPGLRGTFYRRPAGERTESVGVYTYADDELFMAWGYVGEAHCRYAAGRRADGAWDAARRGCPEIRVLRDGGRVVGLALALTDGERLVGQDERTYSPTVNARSGVLCTSR